MLNSTNREALYISSIPNATNTITWDTSDPNIFVAIEPAEFSIFLYSELTINGPEVTQLGYMEISDNGDFVIVPQSTKIPPGYAPILVCDGVMTCQQPGGSLTTITSCTHDVLQVYMERLPLFFW